MKISHFIRNTLIAFFSYSGVTFLYRARCKRKGALVRVLVFHDVSNREWFETLMEFLSKRYSILTPEAFRDGVWDKNKINVLITFDDGYASWVEVVLPVLQKYLISGIFFVNSGLLDATETTEGTDRFMKEQLKIFPRKPLMWEGLQRLREAGQGIGSHAYDHKDLTKLSRESVMDELKQDKMRLESMLGISILECAYPFGTRFHVNRSIEEAAQEVGFERGYTAISRFANDPDSYHIPRMCVEDAATPRSLQLWVEGGYDLFDMVKNICAR